MDSAGVQGAGPACKESCFLWCVRSPSLRCACAQTRFATFDEAVRETEQVMRAPPVAPADSGNAFYTAQPFQVLSWYPRCVTFTGLTLVQNCGVFQAANQG